MRGLCIALAFGGLALTALPADAATFRFSFDISNDLFGPDYAGGGTFEGVLQADGDTILNMRNLSVTYATKGRTYTNTGNPLSAGAVWALSGFDGDWSTELAEPGGMAVSRINRYVAFGQPDIYNFPYNPDDFQIALTTTPIPLPASLPLVLGGLSALVGLRAPKGRLSRFLGKSSGRSRLEPRPPVFRGIRQPFCHPAVGSRTDGTMTMS